MKLEDLVPDVKTLLDLEAPELAGVILQHLCSPGAVDSIQHLGNYTGTVTGNSHRPGGYPEASWREVNARIAEAWAWLKKWV